MKPSRRTVLAAGAAVTTFTIVPSSVLAQASKKKKSAFPDKEQVPPSERLNIGFIGAGGKGQANIRGCMHHNIHTLCDVDSNRAAEAFKHFSNAKKYDDWRVMLDKEAKNLDGVVVTTPDHSHAVATMAAMKCGLPVYTEKPLTRTISESRALAKYAAENRIVTQMGNQGHSNDQARMAVEWIQAGTLGDVKEVHCWTNRPIWPQGIVRPAAEKVPSSMNWDVWLGPAPDAPYSSKIAPFKWRGFWDYGAGALGDMAAHIIDHPVWALGLGAPESVEVQFKRNNPASAKDSFPVSTELTYQFAARGALPPVTLKWFDGKNLPPRPEGLEKTRKLTKNGIIYYGDKYDMIQDCYGSSPRIFPETDMKAVVPQLKQIPKSLPRVSSHYEEWIQAIKANDPAMAKSGFDYAGPLTEMMLLGCVATRVGPGTKLTWDSKNMKTGNDLADRYVQHEYRKGWSL
ncbi:Gfo/Idh/MocA family oxidoreductase [Pontiellaceae bacterium B12227]|nr:Gfo/Idh/MocA family oxidoreductase [Pontiellaceae bacterium B12227]